MIANNHTPFPSVLPDLN